MHAIHVFFHEEKILLSYSNELDIAGLPWLKPIILFTTLLVHKINLYLKDCATNHELSSDTKLFPSVITGYLLSSLSPDPSRDRWDELGVRSPRSVVAELGYVFVPVNREMQPQDHQASDTGVLVYPSQQGGRMCSHLTLYPDYLEKNINTFHCSVFTHRLSSYFCSSTEATAARARRLPRVVCVALSWAPWKLLSKFSADFSPESSALSSAVLEKRKKENTRGGDDCHLLSLLHSHDFISCRETVCGIEVLATACSVSWKKSRFGLASSTWILQCNEAVKATSLVYMGIKPDVKTGIPDIHG